MGGNVITGLKSLYEEDCYLISNRQAFRVMGYPETLGDSHAYSRYRSNRRMGWRHHLRGSSVYFVTIVVGREKTCTWFYSPGCIVLNRMA